MKNRLIAVLFAACAALCARGDRGQTLTRATCGRTGSTATEENKASFSFFKVEVVLP